MPKDYSDYYGVKNFKVPSRVSHLTSIACLTCALSSSLFFGSWIYQRSLLGDIPNKIEEVRDRKGRYIPPEILVRESGIDNFDYMAYNKTEDFLKWGLGLLVMGGMGSYIFFRRRKEFDEKLRSLTSV